MNILLVDDEIQLRQSMRTLVDWQGLGYRYFEAENGMSAIEIMKNHVIDLILLDLTMPVMNGFQVMEWINRNGYTCVVSILTSHDEFDYAKKCLQYGCSDYILKSDITHENILDLLAKMKKELSVEKNQEQRIAAMETSIKRQKTEEMRRTINYWLTSTEKYNPDIKDFFKNALELSDSGARFCAIGMNILNYNSVVNRYTNSNIVQFNVVIDGVLQELLEGYRCFFTQPKSGYIVILMVFEGYISSGDMQKQVSSLTSSIYNSFNSILGIQSHVILTPPFNDVMKLHEQYFSLTNLESLGFFGELHGVHRLSDFISSKETRNEFLTAFELEFSLQLNKRSAANIEACFQDTISEINKKHLIIQPELFINICERCVLRFLIDINEPQFKTDEIILSADATELCRAIIKIVEPYCVADGSQDINSLIKKSQLLIHQNYNQNIGLEWLAGMLWVNSSYLSRLFSQEMGQTVTSYINQYRIEQAKKLIKNTNLRLYEVAEQTGFSSSIVFSTVFKKTTGETPTAYKDRVL